MKKTISVLLILTLLLAALLLTACQHRVTNEKNDQCGAALYVFNICVEIADYPDRGMTVEIIACKNCGKAICAVAKRGVNHVAEDFIEDVNNRQCCLDYLFSIEKLVASTMYSSSVERIYKSNTIVGYNSEVKE